MGTESDYESRSPGIPGLWQSVWQGCPGATDSETSWQSLIDIDLLVNLSQVWSWEAYVLYKNSRHQCLHNVRGFIFQEIFEKNLQFFLIGMKLNLKY